MKLSVLIKLIIVFISFNIARPIFSKRAPPNRGPRHRCDILLTTTGNDKLYKARHIYNLTLEECSSTAKRNFPCDSNLQELKYNKITRIVPADFSDFIAPVKEVIYIWKEDSGKKTEGILCPKMS